MDARQFQSLAETLVQGIAESEWRSAVSRAYYAAFHIARQLLIQCGFSVPHSDRAHRYLILRLSNTGVASVDVAGGSLDVLRSERIVADYRIHIPFIKNRAVGRVQTAAAIIPVLEQAAQEPLKTQITDAMRIYERDVLQDVTWQP